jgi:small subunit ribosomal protein S16
MIKIRLARGGRVHKPVYTIVAIDSRNARNGGFLERLGQYNPLNGDSVLSGVKADRISAWVKQGAEMSPTVRTILKKNNVQL